MTKFADETFELIPLSGGMATLRSCVSGETFHPTIGPMAEAHALHISPQRLIQRAARAVDRFVVWDVGLGAAGNAIAVMDALSLPSSRTPVPVEIHSFDCTLAPLTFALAHADALGYLQPHLAAIRELIASRRTASGNLSWILHLGDFRSTVGTPAISAPDVVLFDPYSPRTNPELWSLSLLTHLRSRMPEARPALLTTYSRSTAVRVTLLLAGFFVGAGASIGAKDETTVAANSVDLLEAPLHVRWLARVAASTASAPLRDGGPPGGRIHSEDIERLRAHPQFQCTSTSFVTLRSG